VAAGASREAVDLLAKLRAQQKVSQRERDREREREGERERERKKEIYIYIKRQRARESARVVISGWWGKLAVAAGASRKAVDLLAKLRAQQKVHYARF